MLRLIVRIDDAGMAANVGGAVLTSYKTFDVELPQIERLLASTSQYGQAQLVGAELLAEPQSQGDA